MTDSPDFPRLADKATLEDGTVFAPRFGPDGTIACVAVDAASGAVLMIGHMSPESLARTIESGEAWYWSRSRGTLWHKGGTSGNVQRVVELLVDCDQDALVARVEVAGHGATCHTGRESCFYRVVPTPTQPAAAAALRFTADEPRFDPAEIYGKG